MTLVGPAWSDPGLLEKFAGNEYVTAIIHVRSIPAGLLIPILRPLVPQWGHFVAAVCSNDIIMVERFASVQRMEAIIKAMDTGQPLKLPTCLTPGFEAH